MFPLQLEARASSVLVGQASSVLVLAAQASLGPEAQDCYPEQLEDPSRRCSDLEQPLSPR